jgi:hypothetical protein
MRRRGEAASARRAQGRGESAGLRRALPNGRRLLAVAAVGLVALAAVGAAGCGGSMPADLGAYVGVWQRVEAGTPDPDFTLTIAARGEEVRLTFANHGAGMSRTVAGTAEGGHLACTLPAGDGRIAASPGPDVPAESDLQLSLDENGQLVVDLVLPDGTLEPIWVYERADGVSPAP